MNTLTRTARRLQRPLAAVLALALALGGCGGGVETGGTGGNATAYASGPITGFGSVIVNGVRFDDLDANVEDGEGGRRSREELRLGMTVEVESSAISTGAAGSSASASRIRFESELLGPVGLVDTAAGVFTLLGQRVLVNASTVFDERLGGGLARLRAGDAVEVYAVFDAAAARYRATRIEPASLSAGLHLRGPVAALDAAAQTLQVGAQTYSYAGATGVPAALAVGQFVRLRLSPVAQRWVVQSFGTALRALAEADGVKVEGLISAYTSSSVFSVGGRPVDASGAAFPGGTAGLTAGARVELEGTLRGGVLRASKVRLVSEQEVNDREFELFGSITAMSAGQATIALRGVTVSTARSDLRYENGTAAQLVVGRSVEVRGVLSAEDRTLEATRIKFR